MKSSGKARIEAIDAARGIALVAMAIYHFGWDLELFGYWAPGTASSGGWRIFARTIATAFLFLVGFSLFLAHGETIRWKAFGKRLLTVALAAMLISAVTWFAFPKSFIFFGILHHIAVASVAGLLFLRLPAWVLLVLAAIAVFAIPQLRSPAFDHAMLWWTGLSTSHPQSNDFVPLFPWFGATLAGIAAARLALGSGFLDWLRRLPFRRWEWPLTFIGRHSLSFYLLHQPVLIACVWGVAQIWPPAVPDMRPRFISGCTAQCVESRHADFCNDYCQCLADEMEKQAILETFMTQAEPDPGRQAHLSEIATQCTVEVENGDSEREAEADEQP